jgi:hypothetical protein
MSLHSDPVSCISVSACYIQIARRVMNHSFDRSEFDQYISVFSGHFKSFCPSEIPSALYHAVAKQLTRINEGPLQGDKDKLEDEVADALKSKTVLLLLDGFNLQRNNRLCEFVASFMKRPSKRFRLVMTSRQLPPVASNFPPVVNVLTFFMIHLLPSVNRSPFLKLLLLSSLPCLFLLIFNLTLFLFFSVFIRLRL